MNRAKKIAFPLLALVFSAVITAAPASASTLAWTVTTPDSWNSSDPGNEADVFTTNTSENLTAIGIPVTPGVNYTTYSIVGVFNASGNLLVSTVAVLNPIPANESGGYFWASFAPTTLLGGQTYTVVVDNNASQPAFAYNNGVPTPGWATFDSSEFLANNLGFVFDPGSSNATPGVFYDIALNGTTAAPEPESLFLLGSGLIGMAGFLRFKLRKN